MPQKRRTLGDRNREAIALDPRPSETTPPATATTPAATTEPSTSAARAAEAPSAPQTPSEVPAGTKSTTRAPQPRTAPVASVSDTARLGIYLSSDAFENAKGAYLADWSHGGRADTFARWIAAALDTYAARTPAQRASAPARGRADERIGATRSFSIPSDTLGRMRAAIIADNQAGRWPSDSAWCSEAISYATENARSRNGGELPTPPPRLPNRLKR